MNPINFSLGQVTQGPLPKNKSIAGKYREFIPPFPENERYGPDELPLRVQDIDPPSFDDDANTGNRIPLFDESIDVAELFVTKKKPVTVDNYIRYRHTKHYIKQRHEAFFGTERFDRDKRRYIRHLFSITDFGRSMHLFNNIEWWKTLSPSPHVYFDYLGIDPDVLELVLEADLEEYMQVLSQPLAIDSFVVRYGAAIYGTKTIPASTETESIEQVRLFQQKVPVRCWITIQDVKYLFFHPDGRVSISFSYPTFRIGKHFFLFC